MKLRIKNSQIPSLNKFSSLFKKSFKNYEVQMQKSQTKVQEILKYYHYKNVSME